MLENRMLQDYADYNCNFSKYDEKMNALAERDDEKWEDMEND